ncbi:hypothetical protein TNCV_3774001 [Trichonephila clavipes]|nr:hypothetical protein TNCV_3774001 [Trichonephila clavipes]
MLLFPFEKGIHFRRKSDFVSLRYIHALLGIQTRAHFIANERLSPPSPTQGFNFGPVVISATCTCPAGGTLAFCKHVLALLHAINDYYIAKKLYEALNFFRSHFFI